MSSEILTVAIGVGLVVSLLFSELFGLAAGGLVVPGYFALFLREPAVIAMTLAIAIATHFIVHMLGSVMILFGKRRTVLVILVAYVLRLLLDQTMMTSLHNLPIFGDSGVVIIGYIIPGLIALWFDRQGVLETICTLIAASVVVRIVLILVFGNELLHLI
jgi:poly-gamma-glutamate biosynthesis protein PgsC/CapC